MLGFGTVMSSGSTACTVSSCVVPENGGLYPSISGDVIFHKRFGFNAEVAWRGKQGLYGGPGGQYGTPHAQATTAIVESHGSLSGWVYFGDGTSKIEPGTGL